MVEGVSALHDVHHKLGKPQIVLCEQRIDGHGLNHVIHQEESLGVLKVALCQVPSRSSLLECATLCHQGRGTSVRGFSS